MFSCLLIAISQFLKLFLRKGQKLKMWSSNKNPVFENMLTNLCFFLKMQKHYKHMGLKTCLSSLSPKTQNQKQVTNWKFDISYDKHHVPILRPAIFGANFSRFAETPIFLECSLVFCFREEDKKVKKGFGQEPLFFFFGGLLGGCFLETTPIFLQLQRFVAFRQPFF